MANIITAGNSTNGGTQITTDTSGTLNIVTGSGSGSNAITIDASQNVGIGASNSGVYGKLGLLGSGYQASYVQSSDASGVTAILAANSSSETRVGSISNHPLFFMVNADAKAKIDTSGNLQFNSGYGSAATAYGCRAWVNFNGTGTVAIRASGNVTSITDNGVGNYTVNMTTAMPDVNYTVQSNATNNGTARANTDLTNSLAVGSFVISTTTNGTNTPQDSALICVSVFR